MFRFASEFLFVFSLSLFAAGCAKAPRVDETTNAQRANQPNQQANLNAALNPHLLPTLKGDIERASLAITMARDAAKINKWQDAVAHLQAANKEVESALDRKPRTREEFEALKSAIDRTITTVQSRGKDADFQLVDLQTRIGAIKVNTFSN
jgi:chromosome segregation ATPase